VVGWDRLGLTVSNGPSPVSLEKTSMLRVEAGPDARRAQNEAATMHRTAGLADGRLVTLRKPWQWIHDRRASSQVFDGPEPRT
jgi:hypothetical protein